MCDPGYCLFLVRSAIYANRNVLSLYHKTHPDLLAHNGKNQPHIIGKKSGEICTAKHQIWLKN